MKKILILALVVLAGASFNTVSAKDKKKKAKVAAQTEYKVELRTANDSVSYASGVALTNGLTQYLQRNFAISEEDMPTVIEGYTDAVARRKDPKQKAYNAGTQVAEMVISRMLPDLQAEFAAAGDSLNEDIVFEGFLASLKKDSTVYTEAAAHRYFETRRAEAKSRADEANKAAGERFLEENKLKEGVVTMPSGLQYKILTKGTGRIPKLDDKVNVIYEGRTIDGKVFDATSRHGSADHDTFTPARLIKGWQEALTRMPVGSKWELYIPYELGYGKTGAGRDIQPYSALIFTMQLVGIEDEPEAGDKKPATAAGAKKTIAAPVKKVVAAPRKRTR